MNLTFSELRKTNTKRCDAVFHPVNSWSPTDWATAMAGECGEACNFIKKLRRTCYTNKFGYVDWAVTDDDQKTLKESIGKELADMVCYADLLAARLDIDLEKAVIDKFNEVSDRKSCNIKL